MYRMVEVARRTGTDTWQTASVVLTDATFTGHENGAADFRLATLNGRPLTISRVEVTKLP